MVVYMDSLHGCNVYLSYSSTFTWSYRPSALSNVRRMIFCFLCWFILHDIYWCFYQSFLLHRWQCNYLQWRFCLLLVKKKFIHSNTRVHSFDSFDTTLDAIFACLIKKTGKRISGYHELLHYQTAIIPYTEFK